MDIEEKLKKLNISKVEMDNISLVTNNKIEQLYAFPIDFLKEYYTNKYYIEELLKYIENNKQISSSDHLIIPDGTKLTTPITISQINELIELVKIYSDEIEDLRIIIDNLRSIIDSRT